MTAFGTPPPGGWVVTGQFETMHAAPGGGAVVTGYQVNFTTGHGASGSVFVPMSRYNRDTVLAMISAKVAELDAVSTLSSDGAE